MASSYWSSWCNLSCATDTSASNLTNTWNYWTTVSTNTTLENVWVSWSGSSTWRNSNAAITYRDVRADVNPPRSDEQVEAARRRHDHRRRQRRYAARRRAKKLLFSHLSDEQRNELREHGHFTVIAPSGRRYCISDHSYMHNVFLLNDQGERVVELCNHSAGGSDLPVYDHMLAQKLALENQEETFWAIANKWDLVGSNRDPIWGSLAHT